MAYPPRNPVTRFWSFLPRGKPNDCWEWQGTRLHHGHGQFFDGTRKVMAHRYAWELLVGPIPEGMQLNHLCDNPPCCNPTHCYVGTQAENMRDKVERGRHHAPGPTSPATGESNGNAKLTRADVDAIRSLEGLVTISGLARRYGVGRTQIRRILQGESWT